MERSLITERVRAGLRRAKAEGKRLGRPRVQVDPTRLASAVRRGVSVRDGARELGVSPSSYARLARARPTKPGSSKWPETAPAAEQQAAVDWTDSLPEDTEDQDLSEATFLPCRRPAHPKVQ